MTAVFYISSAVAILATVMVVTRASGVHALLYLIVSLLAVALVFFSLGAPFVAALEVIVYAGAIMVLFLFTIMLIDQGPRTVYQEREWMAPRTWLGPSALAIVLFGQVLYILAAAGTNPLADAPVAPKEVGIALFGPYLLGVQLAAFLLLAGMVGAYHLGRREDSGEAERNEG